MLPLAAEIVPVGKSGEARSAQRRILRLSVGASTAEGRTGALVLNISERGLLLQSSTDLRARDKLGVELPIAGEIAAVVAWARDGFLGCEFERPVSKAVVSAALLLSPAKLPELTVGEIPPTTISSQSLWDEERSRRHISTEQDHLLAPLIAALLVALAAAGLFVCAMLSFPFSSM